MTPTTQRSRTSLLVSAAKDLILATVDRMRRSVAKAQRRAGIGGAQPDPDLRRGEGAPLSGAVPAEDGAGTGDRGAAGRRRHHGDDGRARPGYVGDYLGLPVITFEPHPDGHADPGEVVWAWVPYEEDRTRGKDRPVVVIGRTGQNLLALPMTSKDHHRDYAQEKAAGRSWFDLGSGPWDRDGRPSEARTNRILELEPAYIRREGAVLDQELFRALTDEVVRRRAEDLRNGTLGEPASKDTGARDPG